MEITKTKSNKLFRDVDMTGGSLPSSLISYAAPLVLTSMLQILYHAADIAVIGNFGSETGVASIGATSSIISFLVNVFIHIATGANILLARYRGANDTENVKRTISTSYVFSLILGIVIMGVGMLFAEPILYLTDCPENVMPGAILYMQIYMIGVPASMFYNFMSYVLRSMGDSRRPFIYLTVSGVTNVVLNLVFALGFGMDVAGVAIATVVSQYLSAILLLVRLVRFRDENRLNPLSLKINAHSLGKIVRYGLPSAISGASFSFSNIIIQSAINQYGDAAMAGNTAAGNIESIFLYSITTPLCQTAAAFIGQNIGAGNRDRVVKIARQLWIYGGIFVAVLGAVTVIFDSEILALFLPGNNEAIDFAVIGLELKMLFCVVYAIFQISNGVMQAFGYTTYQMVNSIIGIVGIRLVWMLVVYPFATSPFMLYVCYPITWLVSVFGSFPVAITLLSKYKKGREFKL